MTKVTFECATIRDVIGKAARVAPTKGSAFDKAAGIMMEVDAEAGEVMVRATNTEVFYMEITDTISIEGPSRKWLLPSILLDGITSKLPISSGSTVVFDDADFANGAQMSISCKRMRAKMRLQNHEYYPDWDAFDPADLSPVSDFAGRIQQVEWAASKTGLPPLTGVHLDGEHACATDRFRVAITPCVIPHLIEPVTVPAAIFAPLAKNLGEVRLGQESDMVLIMPDDSIQIKAVTFADEKYPKVKSVIKRDESSAFMCPKDALTEMIERAMVMGQRDRTPILKMIVGCEEVAVMMEDQEMGLLGDVIELPGQVTHDRHYIGFTPDNLSNALKQAPNKDISFYYHPGQSMKPVRIDGGSGYEALVMPRNLEKSADE